MFSPWAFLTYCSPTCNIAESWGITGIWGYFVTVFTRHDGTEIPDLTVLKQAHMCSAVLRAGSASWSQSCVNKPRLDVTLITCHLVCTEHRYLRNLCTILHCTLKQNILLHRYMKLASSVVLPGLSFLTESPLPRCSFWSHLISAAVRSPVERAQEKYPLRCTQLIALLVCVWPIACLI